MRYVGPARFVFKGDLDRARSHIGEARNLIGQMDARSNNPFQNWYRTLPDGTQMRLINNGGQRMAVIDSPSASSVKLRIPYWDQGINVPFFVDHPPLYLSDGTWIMAGATQGDFRIRYGYSGASGDFSDVTTTYASLPLPFALFSRVEYLDVFSDNTPAIVAARLDIFGGFSTITYNTTDDIRVVSNYPAGTGDADHGIAVDGGGNFHVVNKFYNGSSWTVRHFKFSRSGTLLEFNVIYTGGSNELSPLIIEASGDDIIVGLGRIGSSESLVSIISNNAGSSFSTNTPSYTNASIPSDGHNGFMVGVASGKFFASARQTDGFINGVAKNTWAYSTDNASSWTEEPQAIFAGTSTTEARGFKMAKSPDESLVVLFNLIDINDRYFVQPTTSAHVSMSAIEVAVELPESDVPDNMVAGITNDGVIEIGAYYAFSGKFYRRQVDMNTGEQLYPKG